MIFSRQTGYAIRALVHLAQNMNNGAVLASAIAKTENLPAPFLSKLLRDLSSNGFVNSSKGPGGGFTLLRKPDEIALYDVFILFDGLTLAQDCILGHGVCSDETACCVHQLWKTKKAEVESFLKLTTIADLVKMREKKLWIPQP
ncbi:MAG: Rrf2 family transcriptional regulator [Calditrichaeota bacterium]|nr:Rrf2 family transcriptional regulator [Calditrichota bacterium]